MASMEVLVLSSRTFTMKYASSPLSSSGSGDSH